MRVVIGKSYKFEAAHHLDGLPESHKCSNMHGHSYTLVVSVSCESLDKVGFVVDYAALDSVVAPLVKELDHSVLNESTGVNPTAENLCLWAFRRLDKAVHDAFNTNAPPTDWVTVDSVEIRETERTFARIVAAH